jgi:uncharacterized protein (DUF362 family)
MTKQDNKNLGRREFLERMAKAGLSITAAGAASYLLYDNKGPKQNAVTNKIITLPDFSVPSQAGRTISIVQGRDRAKTVNKAIELLGGMERFIKPGDIVVIKPNAAFASPPILGATTHPDLIAEAVKLCYNSKAKKVVVTDNPINDPVSCFTISGINKAAETAGAEVMLPKVHLFKNISLAGGQLIKDWPVFLGPFEKANKLIGIAPVKNHRRSGASMTMKNWYGLLGGQRSIFHQDINNIIAELAMLVKPTLVILDGTEVMMTNGPTGGSISDLERKNTLIASCDMVAADSFGCGLLDMKISDLPYLAKAAAAGAGTTDFQSLKPIFATAG